MKLQIHCWWKTWLFETLQLWCYNHWDFIWPYDVCGAPVWLRPCNVRTPIPTGNCWKVQGWFFSKIYNHVIWILFPGDLDLPNWTWSGLVRGKDGAKNASVFVPAILEAKWCAEHGASFCIFGKSGSCWANIPIAFLVVRGEERLKLWISLRITCMIHDTKIVTCRLHCNVAFDLFRDWF